MSKTFHFKIEDPEKVLMLASDYDKRSGNGHFSWMGIEGIFHLTEDIFDLDITRKPLVTPWTVIESNLMKFFKQIHLI